VGVLWGRRELLEELPAYKVRPAPDGTPGRWMTGTQNHEGIAGTLAAVEYLADLGRHVAPESDERRAALKAAYDAIARYERDLVKPLIDGLARLPGVRIWGVTDPDQFDRRVPTVAMTHPRLGPKELATRLADRGIFVWHGNFYALPLSEALGLEPDGMVRIGLLHYNTHEEVRYLLDVTAQL
jgi:selenocysteine lyase/cysteine desulfurase